MIRQTHTTSEGEGIVVKINAAGTNKIYATYLGGSSGDRATGIAIDSIGNAYVTGDTGSTDFPHPNGYQTTCADSGCTYGDSFVAVLNTTATAISYGTYLGGTGEEDAMGIALDSQNMVYVTGLTGANFPTTPDRLRATGDSYLTKLNPTAVGADSMVYSTYLGGNNWVDARAIAADASGNAYVAGGTKATDLGTADAAQVTFNGDDQSGSDAYVLKINAAQRLTRHTYDGLERLIGTVEAPGTSFAYTYDLAGNRTAVALNGAAPVITTYNLANQITNAGYTYDLAGNLTNDGTATATFDALNRMTARGSTTYGYNGDGTLIAQTTGGVTTRYTQDLASPLTQVLQTQVGASPRTDYLYGLSRLATQTSGVRTWYVSDALGSVRRTVTDAGVPLGVVSYDPWGTPESGTVPTFGFTGELQPGGDVYLRARWYSTAQGRFGSVDPAAGVAEQPYSLHPYQYAYSAPTVWSDPSGRAVIFLAYRDAFQGQYHTALFIDDNSINGCAKPKDHQPYKPCNGQAATIIEAGPEITDDRLSLKQRVFGFLQLQASWGRINVRPGTRPGASGSDIGVDELADSKFSGTKKIIIDDNKPVSAYLPAMFAYVQRVEQANITYHPLYRNSNSVVSGALEAAGLSIDIAHPYPVPGWGNNIFPVDLTRYRLIFPFTIEELCVA